MYGYIGKVATFTTLDNDQHTWTEILYMLTLVYIKLLLLVSELECISCEIWVIFYWKKCYSKDAKRLDLDGARTRNLQFRRLKLYHWATRPNPPVVPFHANLKYIMIIMSQRYEKLCVQIPCNYATTWLQVWKHAVRRTRLSRNRILKKIGTAGI